MSRIEQAQATLSAAMERLETALTRAPAPSADAASRERRIAELERELARLSEEHMALEAIVDQVAVRLDAAIDRLQTTIRG